MNSNGGSKSRPRTASTGKAANNGAGPYLIVSFLFVAMFLGLIAYLVYFNVVRKEEFLNSSYNTRQNNYAERVIRGTIYSADGQELAKTTTDENGDEVRTYKRISSSKQNFRVKCIVCKKTSIYAGKIISEKRQSYLSTF